MKIFTVTLLLIAFASGLPNKNGAYLKSIRPDITPAIPKPNQDSETPKTANFVSVVSFCAAHPFAGGCEADDEVLVDQRTEEYEDNSSEDTIPSLLTVAFFCSSHPSAIGCPKITVGLNSGDINNIHNFPDIMIRFCILHPSAYGCPKLGIVHNPPSLPLPLPLPPPIASLDKLNEKKNNSVPESFPADIQPYEYRVLTEFFNAGLDSTLDVESLMASTNETQEVFGETEVGGSQQRDELTGITGRSVGETPVSVTNDLLDEQDRLPDASLQSMVQVFESAKVVKPKATLSLPPPVDAIFASGRYAWQKTTVTQPPASHAELSERLNRGKMKPLPSVKQVLGPLAL